MENNFIGLFLVFFILCRGLFGQNPGEEFAVYNDDGTIAYGSRSLVLDSNDFIWIGTRKALIKRIGGNSIHFSYQHPRLDEIDLPRIIEANDRTIVGFTSKGIFEFDKVEETIKWLEIYDFRVIPPRKDQKGNIWSFSTIGHKSFCYKTNGQLEVIDYSKSLENLSLQELNVSSISFLDDDSLLLKSFDDVLYIAKDRILSVFMSFTAKLEQEKVTSFILENGKFFKESTSGSFQYNEKKMQYKYLPKINRQVVFLPYSSKAVIEEIEPQRLRDGQENSKKYILIMDEYSSTIFQVDQKGNFFKSRSLISNNRISGYFLDSYNQLWVTFYGTVFSTSLFNKVKRYELIDFSGQKIDRFNARTIAKTSNGNTYILRNTVGIFELKKGEKYFKELPLKPSKEGFTLEGLFGFYKQNDSVFIGYGWRPEVLVIDIKNHVFSEIKLSASEVNYAINDAVLFDKNHLLLVGGSSVLSLDLNTYKVRNLPEFEKMFVRGQNIHCIYLDSRRHHIWFGMHRNGGLYRKNLSNGEVKHFHKNSDELSLVNDNINVLFPEGDMLWIGTEEGLQKVSLESLSIVKSYTRQDGLKNDNIVSIEASDKILWAATFNGLVKINKKSGELKTLSQNDGFADFEYNRKSILKTTQDSLLIGGMIGLVKIHASEEFSTKKVGLFLTKINYYDYQNDRDVIQTKNLEKIKTINVPYKNNYLFLSFTTNEIFDQEKVVYRYKIDKLNKEWVTIGNNGELFLQGIHHGSYDMKIQAVTSSNKKTNVLTYRLNVDRPFYLKPLFFISCVIVILSILYVYVIIQKEYFERKQTVYEFQAKSTQAQMLPHFTFNTINSIQSVMLTKGEKEANRIIVSYSKLLRKTVDMFYSETISLEDEIEYLRSYLTIEKMRVNFSFTINTIDRNISKSLFIPPMMFQPIIENAIKHGLAAKKGERLLNISFTNRNNVLIGKIVDNGIGIDVSLQNKNRNSNKRKSWATKILKDRIYLFNRIYSKEITLEVKQLEENGQVLGTQSVLIIPYEQQEV